MLNPINIFSSRRGKAAECFNFCRGLKFVCGKSGKYILQVSEKNLSWIVSTLSLFLQYFFIGRRGSRHRQRQDDLCCGQRYRIQLPVSYSAEAWTQSRTDSVVWFQWQRERRNFAFWSEFCFPTPFICFQHLPTQQILGRSLHFC